MRRLDRLTTPIAARAPERLAVDAPSGSLTYGELEAAANRLARMLLACGARPGDRVGIHVPRGGAAVAAMIGALRAGAVYVPLDPASPPARLKLIARDCGLRHLVVSPQLFENWRASGQPDSVEHFILTGEATGAGDPRIHPESEVASQSSAALDPPSGPPEELAYLLYTSGSTGVPKGVMLSHRNALAFVDWAAQLIDLGPGDRVSSVAPFHFDLSVFDVWASLSRGATIVVVDEAAVTSGPRMLERIRGRGITVWYSVPTAITLLCGAGLAEGGAPSLRAVFFAGEVFPVHGLRRAMELLPGARFFNFFGPTETNVCTAYEVPGPPAPGSAAIPIGRACSGAETMIVDAQGKPVADGETGELRVRGPTVMLGYWDGGRRTPAALPYATGDLVSRRTDGELMFHGRRDHQVKVHGFRIELGEVESAIQAHPGVREAIVLPHEKELLALVVPSDPALSVLELKRHCATRLPRYMVPAGVRLLGDLPRTSSGKIDRLGAAAQHQTARANP